MAAHEDSSGAAKELSGHLSNILPEVFTLQTKEAVKFSYVLAVTSILMFIYGLWILAGMF